MSSSPGPICGPQYHRIEGLLLIALGVGIHVVVKDLAWIWEVVCLSSLPYQHVTYARLMGRGSQGLPGA